MRLISAVEWADFFESVSLVEERSGMAPAWPRWTSTCDQYRRAVEELARRSRFNEVDVALRAVSMAAQAAARPAREAETIRLSDPGYFLVAEGREALEKEIGYRPAPAEAFRRAWLRNAAAGYIGTIVFLTLAILAVPAVLALSLEASAPAVVLLALLAAIPASDLAVAFVNRDVGALVPPRRLPKLEIQEGIPAELRTLVAVPTLLASEADIQRLIERLEVHFLASAGGDISFAPFGLVRRRRRDPAGGRTPPRGRSRRISRLNAFTARPPAAARGSCSFTGAAPGTRRKRSGSGGSESAGSSRS
jgi:cyclic beta-1,2-glucan synthetase